MDTLPPTMRSNKVSLAFRRLDSRESHPSFSSICVGLLSLRWSWRTNLAPLRCMVARRSLSFVRCGSHTAQLYSSLERTRAKYASSLSSVGHLRRFLCRKPSDLLALLQMLLIWVLHWRSSLSVIPRYLQLGAFPRTQPHTWYKKVVIFLFCEVVRM